MGPAARTRFRRPRSRIIDEALPDGLELEAVTHMRTSHYAVYRATTTDGASWSVRIGLVSEEDDAPADNSGYQGTSMTSPTGQRREMEIARRCRSAWMSTK